jgi:hypothetical protein
MKSLLIAFGYKQRSGKDAAAKAIIAGRGGKYDIRRFGFADCLKEEVNEAALAAGGMQALFNVLRTQGVEQQNGGFLRIPDWVQYEPNPDMTDPLCPLGKQRTLLQWWGTELRRSQDAFYWVNKLEAKLEQEKPAIALIADMRFTSELNWITANKGFTVRMDRLGRPTGDNETHESDNALAWLGDEDWNYIVQVQDGDLEELDKNAIFVFDHIVELLTPPDLRDIEKFHFVPGDLTEETSGN